MAMKSQYLQAMFARKREMEHIHQERTQAVQKYYDHWDQVTQRYKNWSTPEYYKQAEEKVQNKKDKKEKEKLLEARREKLRQLLVDEKENYNMEIKNNEKSRKHRNYSTSTLERIDERLKEEQNIKRQLELEAKLYGKWRHGVDDEKLIFESKTDNEALAKLNWLDKQVEQQMQREIEEEQAKERDLRLQEELNKAEQLYKERQQIREQEIKEIRALQEAHMEQLKERQEESALLKQIEEKYRENLDNLDKELELLDESYASLQKPADFGSAYNLTKIKVFMRKRSEIYRNHINLCIKILDRCLAAAHKPQTLKEIKEKLSKQLDSEMYQLSQIDAMYESEAKYNLQKCEDLWKLNSSDRYKELKDILKTEHIMQRKYLNDALGKQNDLIDIRSTHLNAIENTSDQLKQLIKEEEDSPRPCMISNAQHCSPRPGDDECRKSVTFSPRDGPYSPSLHVGRCSSNSSQAALNLSRTNLNTPPPLPRESHRARGIYNHDNDVLLDTNHLSNTFDHLNMNTWENDTDSKRDSDIVRMGTQRSFQVVTPDNVEKPKFGRKRVAWT